MKLMGIGRCTRAKCNPCKEMGQDVTPVPHVPISRGIANRAFFPLSAVPSSSCQASVTTSGPKQTCMRIGKRNNTKITNNLCLQRCNKNDCGTGKVVNRLALSAQPHCCHAMGGAFCSTAARHWWSPSEAPCGSSCRACLGSGRPACCSRCPCQPGQRRPRWPWPHQRPCEAPACAPLASSSPPPDPSPSPSRPRAPTAPRKPPLPPAAAACWPLPPRHSGPREP